ncbi:MAG: putative alpha/beta hydrolase [bacterium]|jgi:predicted alpha/beta hydrolase
MIESRLFIPATDNFMLATNQYHPLPEKDNGKVVIIASATGVKRKYYDSYARFLSSSGFDVVTFDYRGIGDSLRGHAKDCLSRMTEWGEKDLEGIIRWVKEHYPEKKLYGILHSVGGQILGLAESSDQFDAVIMVASQHGYWKNWKGIRRKSWAFMMSHIALPAVTHTFSYFPAEMLGFGENLPPNIAQEWSKWCRSPDYLYDHCSIKTLDRYKNLKFPARVYSFSDDHFAPKKAVGKLLELYDKIEEDWTHIRPKELGTKSIGHFGFFREKFRDGLWSESSKWLAAQ